MKKYIIIASSLVVLVFGFWFFFLNHTGANQIGVAFNSGNGDIVVQEHTGWYLTSPLVRVAYIWTTPQRVEFLTAANVQNVRLARIRQDKILEYIKHQGFGYSMGYNHVLIGYVFSSKQYPFIEIIE